MVQDLIFNNKSLISSVFAFDSIFVNNFRSSASFSTFFDNCKKMNRIIYQNNNVFILLIMYFE